MRWRAGLPNFERVSVFEGNGKLLGHVRGWSADEVVFHPALVPVSCAGGVTVYEVVRDGAMGGTALAEGQRVVHRTPERAVLRRLEAAADRAGAVSVIWFAMAGPGIVAAHGVAGLADADEGVKLRVERGEGGEVVLTNEGAADLPVRTVDPEDLSVRGWVLELRAEGLGTFRAGSPGGFALMESAEFSGTVRLHFSHLKAGERLRSGGILSSSGGVEFRVDGVSLEGRLESE